MNTFDNINKWVCLFLILLLSAYIIYQHATSELAVTLKVQVERHQAMIAGNSEFYNPWQYRIFSTFLLEGMISLFNFLLPGQPEVIPYLVLRFAQNVIIFYLSLYYYRLLGLQNPYLIAAGLVILCFCISSSFFQSDLSFNTYFDIIFYLTAAVLILRDSYSWLIPLTLVAASNRETSGFIPLMALAPFSFGSGNLFKKKSIIGGVCLLLFVLTFILLRWYYGYRPAVGIHGMTSPIDFLLFNLTFFRMYPLLLGTLSIIPLIVIIKLRKLPDILQHWFWLIVPFWFIIHLVKGTAMETRLFLVPQALIFLPAFLWLVDHWYKDNSTSVLSSIKE